MKISYESEGLINECRSGIEEFGAGTVVAVWYIMAEGEATTKTTPGKLLSALENQNNIRR